MTTQQPSAQEFKNDGNKALAAGKYAEAIDLYTKAIELDDSNAVFYANRAQAHIKSEAYGSAITDASKAIVLDESYVKAYYRRATARISILRYEQALSDFKTVVRMAPSDKDARAKMLECEKIVRKRAFEKAIQVEEEPSIAETLDLASMKVEESYDGPLLEISFDGKTSDTDSGAANGLDGGSEEESQADAKPQKSKLDSLHVTMTLEFIEAMIERFRNGKLLPRKYVYALVMMAMKLFKSEPTMVEVDVEDDQLMTICGDTHGQFFDLLEIFRRNGSPSESHKYLFNGDFVDRGSWSCEVAILLFCYKIMYPRQFFLNRGNHETDNMNKVYGFEGECKHKFSTDTVFKLFSESFSCLPLASLVCSRYFVVHGGLFSRDNVTLDEIRKCNRFSEKQPGSEGLMMEMLWTDPKDTPGRGPSQRGIGIQFGPDVTDNFCKTNNINAVIRSHEVRMEGYSIEHDGRLITVFSAPNYCDSQLNKGAYINIHGADQELEFETFTAVPHPDVKPMAYASRLMG